MESPAEFDVAYLVVARDGRHWTFADAVACAAFLWGRDARDWQVFRRIHLTVADQRKILETESED